MALPAEPKRITPGEAWALVEEGREPLFLDTRNPAHWQKSEHQIPGSLRIWRMELEERIGEVPRGRPLVTYCACHYEHSSTRAALILEEYDFKDIHILVGGFKAWCDAGLPLEPKIVEGPEGASYNSQGPQRGSASDRSAAPGK
ncbi:MAG TPA: rhodanese-like domain-containing protein [Pyrinomonadaceae bacterium]|jgi:rhodanese-related sulfurtransferase|nr:rhodanese-like domain-containing protein [Pyrinomonadaceae bacterium]